MHESYNNLLNILQEKLVRGEKCEKENQKHSHDKNPEPCPEWKHDKKNHSLDKFDPKTIVIENKVFCSPEKDKKPDGKPECPSWDGNEADKVDSAYRACRKREDEAYACLFLLAAADSNTVTAGADVPLNQADPLQNVEFIAPQATIRKSGNYEVYYSVNIATGAAAAAQIAVAVNGVPLAKTYIPIPTGAIGEFSGNTILTLNRNDVVSIRNVQGSATLTLATSPSVGAQLTLNLLD